MTKIRRLSKNISEYMKVIFKDYQINGDILNVFENSIPKKSATENKENFPYIVIKYFGEKQNMVRGICEKRAGFEILVGVKVKKDEEMTLEYNLEIMEKIKEDFTKTPTKVGMFAVDLKEIETEIYHYAMTEIANKDGYIFSCIRFETYAP